MSQHIQDLIDIGLTENEAKVYCCLIRRDSYSATEISQCSEVNRSKVYTVLSSLMKKGLVIEKLGNIKKYSAIKPELAFRRLRALQQEKLEKIDQLATKLTPIFNQKLSNNQSLDFIEVFSTPCSIINKHHTLELASEETVLSFCKPPYAMSRSLNIHETQRKTMEKGVIFKSIYEAEFDDLDFFCRSMENFESNGEEIRIALKLPVKLHLFDKHTAMFSMVNQVDPKANLTYLVIEHSDLTDMLFTTFETYWANAMTVTEFKQKYHKEESN